MATPSVLTFDAEGRAVDFEVWVDDLQLFLQCDRADGLCLFDLTSGVSPAPPATADSTIRSQWATRDAAARLAVRRHLPTTERAHFSQYKSAQTLYDAVVARYSSLATAALSRLMLPYLFPDLAAFPTVADLITHLRTSDTRYRAALPAEDHFLSVCPTTLTVDLLEKGLLAAEKSIVAVGASRGDPCTPVFEGCSPSPLLPFVASAAAADLVGFESVGAASAPSGRRRHRQGQGGARALEGLAGAVEVVVEAVEGVGVVVGVVAGVAAAAAAVEAEEAAVVAEGAEAAEVAEEAEVEEAAEAASAAVDLVVALRRGVAPVVVRASSSRAVVRPCPLSSFVSGTLRVSACGGPHSTQRCFGRLTDAWRHQFPGASEIPRWEELSRAGVAIFDLDYDAILAAMYAVDDSVAGDCYLCVPPDLGIEAAALGARAIAAQVPVRLLPQVLVSLRSQVLHRTTLTPLSRPVAVSLADPSGGPVLASFSIVVPCPAAPSGTLSGLYLASFSTNLVAASSQVFAVASRSGPESAPCSCRLLSHQTLLWHHRLGHPSLPRLRGMASRVLVSGHPRSLPPLPMGPGPTCVPCVEGRQRAAPHSSEFPPTEAPLQTLHMDVWGPAFVSGQGRERYFLLVVDDYSRYTTVFPLRSKGDVTETFTLPASPQQNGIAERRIGMVMDVARTSMMHAAASHFLWPLAMRLRFGSGDLGRLSATCLRTSCPPVLFLASSLTSPVTRLGGRFYHPISRRVLSSQDVTFDESVPYYHLFPYRTAPLPPPLLFLAPGPPPVDPLSPHGPAPSGVSQVDAVEPVEVAVDSGAARGAEPAGAESGGAETGGAETEGAESGGAESGGAEPGGAEPGGAGSGGAEPRGSEPGALGLLVWLPAVLRRGGSRSLHRSCASGLPAAWDVLLELEVLLLLVVPKVLVLAVLELLGPLELVLLELLVVLVLQELELLGVLVLVFLLALVRLGVLLRLLELELLGVLALAVLLALVLLRVLELALLELEVLLALVLPLRGTGAVLAGSGGAARPRPYFVPLLEQVLGLPPSTGPAPPLECPQPVQSQSQLQARLPSTCSFSLHWSLLEVLVSVVSLRLVLRRLFVLLALVVVLRVRVLLRSPAHTRWRCVLPLLVCVSPLPSPPESSLPTLAYPDSDSLLAASPSVTRLLAAVVTDPSFESTAASALVAELVDFAARSRLDYAASLV
ncbi:unnamed protein product, partial [Closterium sp. NIES-65]